MATIAEFSIPADGFPLGHLFESFPNVTIEVERVVPTNHAILPYFWVRGAPIDSVEKTFEAEGALESYTLVDEVDDQGLFRAEWDSDVEGVLTGILEAKLSLLSATGTEDDWEFEFRAEDTTQIAAFQQYCIDHDITIELKRLHSLRSDGNKGQYSLTPDQREAVLLAFNKGYYETPPKTNLGDLAEELEITRQSFSDRLRRGLNHLIGETLAVK